jgi:hypothetical protein
VIPDLTGDGGDGLSSIDTGLDDTVDAPPQSYFLFAANATISFQFTFIFTYKLVTGQGEDLQVRWIVLMIRRCTPNHLVLHTRACMTHTGYLVLRTKAGRDLLPIHLHLHLQARHGPRGGPSDSLLGRPPSLDLRRDLVT